VEAGDTFLLEATKDFLRLYQNHRDFALVSVLEEESILPRRLSLSMLVAVMLVAVMIAEATASVAPLSALAMVTVCVLVLMNVLTWQQALRSVDGEVLIVIAAAFALGNAMTETRAAAVLAESLLDVFGLAGDLGVLFGLYLITALMSAVISNAATVTLMFPIAIQFSQQMNLSYEAVLYTLMLAGSASFATPVGYQTNLMVEWGGVCVYVLSVCFGNESRGCISISLYILNLTVLCVRFAMALRLAR
jgi:di/tricarboxylate transporter